HLRGPEPPGVRRQPPSPGELGAWPQGHRDRLPRRNHAREGALRPRRPLRLALPHRRARGQRDDAALSDRTLRRPRPTKSSGGAKRSRERPEGRRPPPPPEVVPGELERALERSAGRLTLPPSPSCERLASRRSDDRKGRAT